MSDENLHSVRLSGYHLVADFCRRDKIHGGVVIFSSSENVNSCKNLKQVQCLSLELDIECCAIAINKQLCIVVIYRSPNGNLDTFFIQLCKVLDIIVGKYENIIICGDININFLESSFEKKLLCDILESYDIDSLIKEPTRFSSRKNITSATAIDYVITNVKTKIDYSVIETGLSDHCAQMVYFTDIKNQSTSVKKKIFRRRFSDSNINEFIYLLNKYTSPNVGFSNINEFFENFWEHFAWAFEISFPKAMQKGTSCQKKNNAWYTEQLKKESENLKKLNQLRKRSPSNTELQEQYKIRKKQYNRNIAKAKTVYFTNTINRSDNKIRSLWKIVNERLNKNKIQPELKISHENNLISDETEIANIFGNYFVSIIDNQLKSHFVNNISNSCTLGLNSAQKQLLLEPFTAEEIKQVILNLKNKKSTGYDEVPVILLKKCCCELSEIIAVIINKSLEFGEFPSRLKISVVTPIFKKDNPLLIENYRPISLLSIFSKIIEKAVCNRINKFLTENNLLNSNQYGFREGRSTETAIVNFIQFVNDRMDKKEYIVGLFFDLTRAFDCLNFNFIIDKVSELGIQGKLAQWIYSFLKDRKLIVRINGKTSNEYNVTSGIPQGSVLGPLIFLMFINDLPDHIRDGTAFMFADDTSIIISSPDTKEINDKVNSVLNQFNEYCYKNRLIVNYPKTVAIEFHRYSRPKAVNSNIHINSQTIALKTHCKFLGTIVDELVKWDHYINFVCSKLNKQYYALLNLKSCLSEEGLLSAYYALVYSTISYNIIVYGMANESERVFIAQKRIIRLMYNLECRQSCRPTFKEKKIMTFASIYLYKLLSYIYSNKDQFTRNLDVHSYPTRKNDQIRLDTYTYMSYRKSPQYAGCYLFNMLPSEIKNASSLNRFRSTLRQYLLENSPYTVDEFVASLQNS